MNKITQPQAMKKARLSPLKTLSVGVLNIALLMITLLLAYEIYTNRYGLGLVCLIIALVLGVPLVMAVDLWAISGITVYTSRNVQRIRNPLPLQSLLVEEIQKMILLERCQISMGLVEHYLRSKVFQLGTVCKAKMQGLHIIL